MMVRPRMAKVTFCGKTCKRYAAYGWPSSDSRAASISTTVYATTSCRNQPNSPPTPLVSTMARGEAMLALEHSSLKWNGAS